MELQFEQLDGQRYRKSMKSIPTHLLLQDIQRERSACFQLIEFLLIFNVLSIDDVPLFAMISIGLGYIYILILNIILYIYIYIYIENQ